MDPKTLELDVSFQVRKSRECEEVVRVVADGDFKERDLEAELERASQVVLGVTNQLELLEESSSTLWFSVQSHVASAVRWLTSGDDEADDARLAERSKLYASRESAKKRVALVREGIEQAQQARMEAEERVALVLFRWVRLRGKLGPMPDVFFAGMMPPEEAAALKLLEEDVTAERERMKAAVLKLAHGVDPKAARCAELLGRMLWRTPGFFMQLGALPPGLMVGMESGDYTTNAGDAVLGGLQYCRFLPDCSAYVRDAGPGELQERVANLLEGCRLQDCNAICEAMGLLALDELPPEEMDHLTGAIPGLWEAMDASDQKLQEATGRRCAMTANFPEHAELQPDSQAYAALVAKIRDVLDGKDLRAEEKYLFEELDGLPFDAQLSRCLDLIDDIFDQLPGMDGLWHLTPPVLEVCFRVNQRGLTELKAEALALYNHVEWPWRPTPHWFERRAVAARICKIASGGHLPALEFVCKRLLRDSHWMIRELAVDEACRLLGMRCFFGRDASLLQELALAIVCTLCGLHARVFPMEEGGEQAGHDIQVTAERAVGRELPSYPTSARSLLLSTVDLVCTSCPECNPWRHRVFSACAAAKIPSQQLPNISKLPNTSPKLPVLSQQRGKQGIVAAGAQ